MVIAHINWLLIFYFTKEQELETLKRKSPSDLWKEDLAAFIEELEVSSL